MKRSLGFTLAEVLITLAIIGVVAAMTIPSVIVNTNQAEFKTALKKAVSVLNSAITMNIALEGESPYDNENLFGYLQQHMSILKSTSDLGFSSNSAFYTNDGLRFELPSASDSSLVLHETGEAASFNQNTSAVTYSFGNDTASVTAPGTCGSAGLTNVDEGQNADAAPCLILVDVNGDRKPNPSNAQATSAVDYKWANPGDSLLKDIFTIMITDDRAVPFGTVAQKAMFQSSNTKTSASASTSTN